MTHHVEMRGLLVRRLVGRLGVVYLDVKINCGRVSDVPRRQDVTTAIPDRSTDDDGVTSEQGQLRRARARSTVGDRPYEIFRLDAVGGRRPRCPSASRCCWRTCCAPRTARTSPPTTSAALAGWDPTRRARHGDPVHPGPRDHAGLHRRARASSTWPPCARRWPTSAATPSKINPLAPAELVIDHSVIADVFGTPDAFERNVEIEYERNRERYQFLRWGQGAFDDFKVVPPGTGIVHQVNIEHLARVVFIGARRRRPTPTPCVGTDSHTTMVNGLGVLGWGVGGIEAEAAMLGQPVSMLIPRVVGFKLTGELPEGATATDLVLTITEMLRQHGVVGKFVEFYGAGVGARAAGQPGDHRQHEPGVRLHLRDLPDRRGDARATCGSPAAAPSSSRWSRPTPRSRACGTTRAAEPRYSEHLELDLSTVVPSLAGPKRPQDRVPLAEAKDAFRDVAGRLRRRRVAGRRTVRRGRRGVLPRLRRAVALGANGDRAATTRDRAPGDGGRPVQPGRRSPSADGTEFELDHGAVVIAAITSCTNTSNPSVMIGAGAAGQEGRRDGACQRKPWVKTTLAPGSKVVTDYYERAGLTPYLEKLGFHLVGYGCTTCIGNSGPLIPEVSARRSTRATSPSSRCCRATATSRAGSTPTSR